MEDRIKKAVELLGRCDSVQLASITPDGYPRACEMELLHYKGLSEIYFTTLVQSAKTEHFAKNPKAGVSFSVGENSVSLVGDAEIIHDLDVKKELWDGEHNRRFAVNEDGTPKCCIIKFRTTGATLYVDRVKDSVTF